MREEFFVECLVAYGAFLAVCQSVAFRTQPRVWSHGAVVGEAPLALRARLAALAAGVESSFELSPTMLEFRSRFVLVAGGASVWPRFRRALVAHPAAFRVLPQLSDLERLVARAASAKGILVLELTRAADVGLRGEVPQLSLLRASGAWRGRSASWHLHTG